MTKLDIVGREFGSMSKAVINEMGDWDVVVSMIEKRLVRGKEWEEKEISTQCTHKEFSTAYSVAMQATIDKFNQAIAKSKDTMFPDGGEE